MFCPAAATQDSYFSPPIEPLLFKREELTLYWQNENIKGTNEVRHDHHKSE